MKTFLKAILISCLIEILFSQQITKESAGSFLQRSRRFLGIFEEMKQGDMERECFEEICNKEENYEVFDHDERHKESWSKLKGCSLKQSSSTLNVSNLRNCYRQDQRKLPPPK